MPNVTVTNLHKSFNSAAVLHDLSFSIADGEFFTLLGPSGCGKSTTLSCLAGLEKPTSGRIDVGGVTFFDSTTNTYLPPEERDLGMVFQSYALWPHMTVAQNLAMPLNIRRIKASKQRILIDEALDKVGLGHLAKRYPHELSGGQQQRVALARALVYSPRILLLDEPLSNLDAKLREQARIWLKKLQVDTGITTIYVTHDQEEALAMSDRIAVMDSGDMLQIGSPTDIYIRPTTPVVAAFVGRSNFLTGIVTEKAAGDLTILVDGTADSFVARDAGGGVTTGDRVTFSFRPENVKVSSATTSGIGAAARVVSVSYVGSRYEYHLEYAGQLIEATGSDGELVGDVRFTVAAAAIRTYEGTGAPNPEVAELAQATI